MNSQLNQRTETGAELQSEGEAAEPKGALSLPEVRIAVLYVLVASLWIIGSDALLHRTDIGRSNEVFLQSFKGLNFVITTGLLLYFVLRRAFGGWREAEGKRLAAVRSARECYRNLSSRIRTLREEERTRISREVHDELGQLLTGVKMQLRLIEDRLGNREDRSLNPAIDELVEASAMIDETIASVQRISSGLRPLALDHLGLAAALDEESEQFTKRTGIECNLKLGEIEDPLPPEVETAAFRIFQESLTNVARHSEAGKVEAECTVKGDVLMLTVLDDGVGIDPEIVCDKESLGLVGMFERAADAGGRVEFKAAAGRGTEMRLTIPLAGETRLPELAS